MTKLSEMFQIGGAITSAHVMTKTTTPDETEFMSIPAADDLLEAALAQAMVEAKTDPWRVVIWMHHAASQCVRQGLELRQSTEQQLQAQESTFKS